MHPLRSFFRYAVLFCALVTLASAASAQGRRSSHQMADSLKRDMADHRLRIQHADSAGDAKTAIELRRTLAVKLKPKEAVKLLQEAVIVADSAALPDERLGVREDLARQFSRAGDHRRAYELALEVAVGRAQLMNDRGLEHGLVLQRAVERWDAERDSVGLAWNERLKAADAQADRMEATAERWMWIATSAGALFLLLLAVLLFRSSRAQKRTHKELAELRAEIAALKDAPKNRLREEPKEPIAPPDPPAPAVPAETKAPALDAQVLTFFQKMAPERLRSLRDARVRGDNEKVVRVVHTLKPQLIAIDAVLYGDLCAAITTKDALNDLPRWNADVDQLEAAVERLLG